MPKLSSPVGRGAPNRPHDVAMVQAALASIPVNPSQPFGAKLWTRPVDGRASPALDTAINQFQQGNRLNPTGRIETMGPDLQVIDRLLPHDRKGLAVIENCSAVLCSSLQPHQGQEAQRVARERTRLPRQQQHLREGLGDRFTVLAPERRDCVMVRC